MIEIIFRGEVIKEVRFIKTTKQWVVNGKIIIQEGLSETEKLMLENAKSKKNWKLLKGETKITGKLC